MRILLTLIAALLTLSLSPKLHAQDRGINDFAKLDSEKDWPWWRGPSRNGWADEASKPPTTFSSTQGVQWKVPIPGRGHASPVVVGNQVFVATADTTKQTHSILAYDKSSGKQNWNCLVSQGGFPERNHPKNTEASPTLACDGERIFATFFHHKQIELVALSLDGKIDWKQTVGPFNPSRYEYGYAPSPLLYKDLVIVAAEHDGESYIKAFERSSRKIAWTVQRPANITFSSPVIAHVGGRDQLLLSGSAMVASYDPSTGKLLWQVPATTAATCGTLVWTDNMIFASGGYPDAGTYAIRLDGNNAEVVWQNGQKCYEQSMIIVGDYVYALTDNGVMFCWSALDGTEQWKQRLAGPVSASPVFANNHIYWANEAGQLYVFQPSPKKYLKVAVNQVGDEAFASPAISGNQLFLRVAHQEGSNRQEYLYCFAE